jgi:hypothetical protein
MIIAHFIRILSEFKHIGMVLFFVYLTFAKQLLCALFKFES